VPFLLTSDIQT